MRCVICKNGETTRGTATVTLERGTCTLVIRRVPADVCTVCGEEYISAETTRLLQRQADEATASGVATQVRTYRAA